jgi:hypothetical protein
LVYFDKDILLYKKNTKYDACHYLYQFISKYEYLIEGTNANTNIQPVLTNFELINNFCYFYTNPFSFHILNVPKMNISKLEIDLDCQYICQNKNVIITE